MEKIIDNTYNNTRVFEVVDKWPSGDFTVWNIGRHNFKHEGFIPLCQTDANYHINPNTLKALNVGDETLCLAVLREAGHGTVNERRFEAMRGDLNKLRELGLRLD